MVIVYRMHDAVARTGVPERIALIGASATEARCNMAPSPQSSHPSGGAAWASPANCGSDSSSSTDMCFSFHPSPCTPPVLPHLAPSQPAAPPSSPVHSGPDAERELASKSSAALTVADRAGQGSAPPLSLLMQPNQLLSAGDELCQQGEAESAAMGQAREPRYASESAPPVESSAAAAQQETVPLSGAEAASSCEAAGVAERVSREGQEGASPARKPSLVSAAIQVPCMLLAWRLPARPLHRPLCWSRAHSAVSQSTAVTLRAPGVDYEHNLRVHYTAGLLAPAGLTRCSLACSALRPPCSFRRQRRLPRRRMSEVHPGGLMRRAAPRNAAAGVPPPGMHRPSLPGCFGAGSAPRRLGLTAAARAAATTD